MNQNQLFIGNTKLFTNSDKVEGNFVTIEGESFYKISNSNKMRPFFMSMVSDSNHWMFISSNGGLTAGRKDCDTALFPYYTDDKITESAEITGSKTIFQIHKAGKILLWEPFSDKYEGIYAITRNLYKNNYGNKIIFEEVNHDLGLTFQYQWNNSNSFGFVKIATLLNNAVEKIQVTVLDGIQNILPFGLSADLQNSKSNLVDAYKKSEMEAEIGLGIYALSAIIVDKAEPSEALKATTAWAIGLKNPKYLLSSLQLNNFRKGLQIQQEIDIRAEKGAYFICAEINLEADAKKTWMLAANVNQGPAAIVGISEKLKSVENLEKEVLEDIELGTKNLIQLAGNSDGLQVTNDELRTTRHYANTLFNIMRGGIFDENYLIDKDDFTKYLEKANKNSFKNNEKELSTLPITFSLKKLKEIALTNKDTNFKRLCFEYMPLKFSRRHGDPSRPWNKFSINTRSEIDGSKILDYEGNWRDIFQNWEALAHAYPEFIESMIHKFLNATTFDGYNPYRVTKGGFDWEVIEPDDPWSFIGYWGDHQIIYLLKFLEFAENHYPNKLAHYFDQELFVYANVPYKIKSYSEILKNPKDTIDFDHELNQKINQKKVVMGADGALLPSQTQEICKVNLIEKLLATVLAKLSNFIPEAGIWLNTQRPEWNDANNALVGNGVSMVTLYYLQRFLNFFEEIVENTSVNNVSISEEMVMLFKEIVSTFEKNKHLLSGKISDADRKTVVDQLGLAGSHYRTTIYEKGFTSHKSVINKNELSQFFGLTKKFIDHTINANKRADNLFHSYNLMTIENEQEISISYLPEMLEGQVSVLSSGHLSPTDSLALLNSLRKSALYRKDQNSYILYPNKQLKRFIDKNNIPAEAIEKSELVKQLLKNGNSQIIEKDVLGNCHFNGNFNNANSLKFALGALPYSYQKLVEKDQGLLLTTFENIFNHKSFTGRSGTFFGYEGLGSIYWHMVSKLALAVEETCLNAIESGAENEIIAELRNHYHEITEGIGVHKSPEVYGAFPTDPYSHTPGGKGAQQPGMTGQVKEDFLARMTELGVSVANGTVKFQPYLLKIEEFLKERKTVHFTDVNLRKKELMLEKNSLFFTYCQVPVVYKLADKNTIQVIYSDEKSIEIEGLSLDKKNSELVFQRNGRIANIIVSFQKNGEFLNISKN
jgi:predicted site-specific integrase-resolvase